MYGYTYHVCTLDIPVDDVVFVQVVHSLRDVQCEVHPLRPRQRNAWVVKYLQSFNIIYIEIRG